MRLTLQQETTWNRGLVKAISIMSSSSHRWVLKYPYLGRSFQSGRPVASLLNATIPNTLLLALTAMMFATFCGIILGMLAAMHNRVPGWTEASPQDRSWE